jgi:hypothetical protein
MTSCVSANYYQVYKANPESGTLTNNKILFQDKNCKVFYDLWEEGGNIGFSIYNDTDNDMVLDLTKSFFVLNGVSFEYFQKRTFTKTNGSGASVSANNYSFLYSKPTIVTGAATSSFSTSFVEKPSITIPPKTMIEISEFQVSLSRHLSCDLPIFPTAKTIKTARFDKTSSPFVFSNIISYTIETETTRFKNDFFVSELTNLPAYSIFTYLDKSVCGKDLITPIKTFKNISPDKFYVKYTREN